MVGPAMDIDYTFDIVWTIRFFSEVRRVNDISGSLLSDYSDSYTIPVLSNSDRFITYRCEVVVNFNQPSTVGYGDFTLDSVIGMYMVCMYVLYTYVYVANLIALCIVSYVCIYI